MTELEPLRVKMDARMLARRRPRGLKPVARELGCSLQLPLADFGLPWVSLL